MKSNLKQFRTEAGYTLQTIGDMCGISKSHMHDLEKESGSSPKLTTAYAIAKVLDKSVYEIWPDETEIIVETVTIRRVIEKPQIKTYKAFGGLGQNNV